MLFCLSIYHDYHMSLLQCKNPSKVCKVLLVSLSTYLLLTHLLTYFLENQFSCLVSLLKFPFHIYGCVILSYGSTVMTKVSVCVTRTHACMCAHNSVCRFLFPLVGWLETELQCTSLTPDTKLPTSALDVVATENLAQRKQMEELALLDSMDMVLKQLSLQWSACFSMTPLFALVCGLAFLFFSMFQQICFLFSFYLVPFFCM